MITFEKYLSMTDEQKSVVKSDDFDAKDLADVLVKMYMAIGGLGSEVVKAQKLAKDADNESRQTAHKLGIVKKQFLTKCESFDENRMAASKALRKFTAFEKRVNG